MSLRPRDWIDPMCRTWGAQKRGVWFGSRAAECSMDSLLGRIKDEKVGAGARHGGRVFQYHPEVYTGDGLMIQRAIQGLPEDQTVVLHAHFVIILPKDDSGLEPVERKAAALQLGRSQYFSELDKARYFLAGRIDRPALAQA